MINRYEELEQVLCKEGNTVSKVGGGSRKLSFGYDVVVLEFQNVPLPELLGFFGTPMPP